MLVGLLLVAGAVVSTLTAAPPPEQPQAGEYRQPGGYKLVEGPAGSTIEIPSAAAQIDDGDTYTVWRDEATGAVIQVDSTPWGTTDPVEHWEQLEANADSLGPGLSDLQRVGLSDRFDYRGWPAADFTFTFSRNGTPSYGYARGFQTKAGPFAIFVSAPQNRWEEAKSHLDHLWASFES